MEAFTPVLDDDAILDGSNARWGYRKGGVTGEVFFYDPKYRSDLYVLEVYDHDGHDNPVAIETEHFGYTEAEVLCAIKLALELKGVEDQCSSFAA